MMHIWQMILNFDQQLHVLIAMHASLVYLILFLVVFLEIGVVPLFFCQEIHSCLYAARSALQANLT